MKRYDKIVLILLLAIFGVGIFMTARNALSSYVTFTEARATDRAVQVKGLPLEGTLEELDSDSYVFQMEDSNGEVARVVASGQTPENLFEADSVVAKGKYQGDEFLAQNILVKCPSKYEAEEHPDNIER